MAPPALRPSWFSRQGSRLRLWVRSISKVPALRRPPTPAGISSGRVATPLQAESDLSALATSPTVFAAVTSRAQSLVTYPIQVYTGYGIAGGQDPLDPEEEPWAGALLRLLQTPDPADLEALFPARPGETLLSQLIADLLLTGNAFAAITSSPSGDVVGLARLHPRHMTLERRGGEEFWLYRGSSRDPRTYPRRTVAHLRSLSWEAGGRGELGTGAGTALAALVAAERQALQRTADVVSQGGADVMITGKTPASAAFLSNPANREKVAREASSALAGGREGRRVFVVGGDLEVSDAGLTPADLQAPELMAAARAAELMALGATPISVGADAGSYATAVQQYRAQAAQDEGLAYVIEAGLLRPLARHFAKRSGGRWARRADQVTCRIDLSSHPGYAYLRTDAMGRMRSLVELGWSPSQAAAAEGLRLPDPEGSPRMPGGASPAQPGAQPRRPLGDTETSPGDPAPPREASESDWLSRLLEPVAAAISTPDSDPVEESRRAEWLAVEERRQKSDAALERAARMVLEEHRDQAVKRVKAALQEAERSAPVLARAGGDDPEVPKATYGKVDWSAVKGDPAADAQMYLDGMAPDYAEAWEDAARSSLEGTTASGTPVPAIGPRDMQALQEAMEQASKFSTERMIAVSRAGVAEGQTIAEIAFALMEDQAFSPARALRIARTETVRAESFGAQARYREAARVGVQVRQEWRSARDGAVRESHARLDGQVRLVGEAFTLDTGSTLAPGLSGIGGEDINCRCTLLPHVVE